MHFANLFFYKWIKKIIIKSNDKNFITKNRKINQKCEFENDQINQVTVYISIFMLNVL